MRDMAEVQSADQVRAERIRDMGCELGEVYHGLWCEAVWLHAKWALYRQLYAHSPDRYAFLQKVAGHFFKVVEDVMCDDVLLHLMRLIDRSKGTLTLSRLPKLVISQPRLASELKKLIQAAEKACESAAKASRDNRIAHMNRALALNRTFNDLPSRLEIEDALSRVRAVLDRLEEHFWHRKAGCQYFNPSGGDADSLVHYLLKANEALGEQRFVPKG
jgi:hypothetical protein